MLNFPKNISDAHRCIFIHVPKTAGTAIKRAFGMSGAGHLPWHYYSICYPEKWEQYTSFAVVRNPWDRVVSAYRFAQMKESYWHGTRRGLHADYNALAGKSLEECLTMLLRERRRLRNEAWFEQMVWVANPKVLGSQVMVDEVLRYENLHEEFPQLCRKLGVEPPELAKVNLTDREPEYRQYYDDRTRKLVERIYAADIEAFGYSF